MRLCSLTSSRFLLLLLVLLEQNVHKYTNCAPSGLEKACLYLSAPQRWPIKLAISVACSMLKDVPFFVRRTAFLVSLYITKHLFFFCQHTLHKT